MVRSSVLLPQPDGPTKTANSPSATVEIKPLQRMDGAVIFVQPRNPDFRHPLSPYPLTAPSEMPRTR